MKNLQQIATRALLLLMALAPLGVVAWAQEDGTHPETQPWRAPAEATGLYWLLVVLTVGGLLAFALWTLYGRLHPGRLTSTGYHALGILVIVMALFTLALYVIPATQAQHISPTARAWDWKPGEMITDPSGSALSGEPYRGYLVHLANGCTYCHTLYLRPQDIQTGWGEGARPEEVSQMGDYVNYPFTMLGTQRDGPDLTVIGRKIPNMQYQIDHLLDPRKFKSRSIMPTYRYLSEKDLRDLAAFLVSLGNDPQKLRSGQVVPPPPPTEDPRVAKGRELYSSFSCIACHTLDGTTSTGPTWKDLYGRVTEVILPDGTAQSITADETYLRESMLEPEAKIVKAFSSVIMPDTQLLAGREVTEEEIQALLVFIKSLSQPQP